MIDIRRGYEIGIKDAHLFVWAYCSQCNKGRWVRKDSEPRLCHSCSQLLETNHNWKGGRRMEQGYIWIKLSRNDPFYCMTRNGYIVEHRLIMARSLNRPLLSQEIVHHLDGSRTNNNIENLRVVTRNSHATNHYKVFHAEYQETIRKISELESKIDELVKLNRLLLWHITQSKVEVNNA